MIHYIQPYATDKNIGRAYNGAIALMPDDCWVGIVDHDAMFLRPDSKAQIEHIIQDQGDKWGVLGVTTNRLAGAHQLYNNTFNESGDIRVHLEIADKCHNDHYGKVVETKINIAGVCMLFKKEMWLKVRGFKENSIRLDSEFTDSVMESGGRLGIMQGVYMFHLYRMRSNNPVWDVGHLIG